jgi:hypothetical protein
MSCHTLRKELRERAGSYSLEEFKTLLSLFPVKTGLDLKLLPDIFLNNKDKLEYDCITGEFKQEKLKIHKNCELIPYSPYELLFVKSWSSTHSLGYYDIQKDKIKSFHFSNEEIVVTVTDGIILVSKNIKGSEEFKFFHINLSGCAKEIKFFTPSGGIGGTEEVKLTKVKQFCQLNKNCIITKDQESIKYWWRRKKSTNYYDLAYQEESRDRIRVAEFGKNSKVITDATVPIGTNEIEILEIEEKKWSRTPVAKYSPLHSYVVDDHICLNSLRPTIVEYCGEEHGSFVAIIYDRDSNGEFSLLQQIHGISQLKPLTASEFVCITVKMNSLVIYSRKLENDGEYQVIKRIKCEGLHSSSEVTIGLGVPVNQVEKLVDYLLNSVQLPKALLTETIKFLA